MLESLFDKVARPKACNFTNKKPQVFFYEICELSKDIFLYRTPLVAASENNEQQQSSEDFVNSSCKIVSPILRQELINDIAVCKISSGTFLQF